jgi:hypothetical protein
MRFQLDSRFSEAPILPESVTESVMLSAADGGVT